MTAMWLQNLVVFVTVAACLGYVTWQGAAGLFGRKSKLGSCCSKGCSRTMKEAENAASTRSRQAGVQFIPLEAISRRRSK